MLCCELLLNVRRALAPGPSSGAFAMSCKWQEFEVVKASVQACDIKSGVWQRLYFSGVQALAAAALPTAAVYFLEQQARWKFLLDQVRGRA